MDSAYAELHCLSSFTFLRGASQPEELVERAHRAGYAALAITDECSFAAAVRAHVAARPLGLKLIFGTEIRLADGPRLVLLACNRNGYGNLAALVTRGRRAAGKGEYRLSMADMDEGLADCLALLIPTAAPGGTAGMDGRLADWAAWLRQRFAGRCWLAVELHRGAQDAARLAQLLALSRSSGLPAVAAGDVHMHVRARRPLQDALTATRLKTTVDAAGHALFPNGERHLRTRAALARLYPPPLLAQTLKVAARCNFQLDELRYEYPEELVPAGQTAAGYLRRLTEAGYRERLAQIARLGLDPAQKAQQLRDQIEHELALIAELKYEPYFLTVQDIVAYARSRGILCQGRGSAANSAVCYCLGITEVDPWRANMLFERFISRERNEPPDIDVDFEHERREEVIQYLYGKYGRERAALAATVITYRPKSALKDMGRALGFDLDRLNHLTRNLAWWDRREQLPQRLQEAGFDPQQPRVRRLLELSTMLIGFPRHLSQHVGGFVISRGPLQRLVPIENAAMAERTVIQWDKDDLDALGLLKVDVLALGMLSAIRRGLELVAAWEGRPFALADIPPEDPAVYAMIGHADTVGVFQVESRAQMSMLPRLKPRCYYDLVIEVAIVRPGPIQGGMVHPYLRNRAKHADDIEYPSPALRSVLERTLGVPIFQEQVMQIAVVAAGFSPGEADQLRRSMAAWRRKGGLERFEAKLIDGMRRRGYDEAFAQRIYQQICGFGEYGFPESHAASFALLVYASAWLKCHHPAAFLCALLNAQPMGFYLPAQLIQDARRHGVAVLPADVTASDWDCTLEAAAPARRDGAKPAVRLGLRLVKGLAQDAAQRIVTARAAQTAASVDELAFHARLERRDLETLAAAGALAALAGHRRHACWQAAGAQPPPRLLAGAAVHETAVRLSAPGEAADIAADYRHLGFTLGRHPLALLRPRLQRLRFVTARELNAGPHNKLMRVAGLVTCRQRPATASGVVFITLEDETGVANIIVHASLSERQHRELLGAHLLGVYGQLQREGEVVHLIAKTLVDRTPLLGGLAAASRDFH